MIRLGFHGGARTVTGSRFLLSVNGDRLLVDCGAFQGLKELRLRNWTPPSFEPWSVDWIVLTHGHIDHCGYLPRLVKDGFRGRIYTTPPTKDVIALMLRDAAHLHEEEAEYRNWKGTSRHSPALPLFDLDDVEKTMRLVEPHRYGLPLALSKQISIRFADVGHLLGSAMVQVDVQDGSRKLTILFSGDVGRYGVPLYPDPGPPPPCDVLLVESTYGDRLHGNEDIFAQVQELAARTFSRNGILLVPAFAVGRAQQVTYVLRLLMEQGRIPAVPIHIDSPMAVQATRLYGMYPAEHRMDDPSTAGEPARLSGPLVHLHTTREESKTLNKLTGPAVIISASGMLAGGRILHHLVNHLPGERNMVMMTGYQAAGTRGRALLEGAQSIRIFGQQVPVKAEVHAVHGMSGHADANELLTWLTPLKGVKRRAFVIHGEARSADVFAARLRDEMGWDAVAPALDETVEL